MHFVTALTSLFESIAMIIVQHQPVVEKYYGNGKMYSVIQRLLQECDRVVISLIASWEDERSVKRKVRHVVICATGLNSSLLLRDVDSLFGS